MAAVTTKKLQLELHLLKDGESKKAYINLPAPVTDDLSDPDDDQSDKLDLVSESMMTKFFGVYATDDGFTIDEMVPIVVTTTTDKLCDYIGID